MPNADDKFVVAHSHLGLWPKGTKLTRGQLVSVENNPDRLVELGSITPLTADNEPMTVDKYFETNQHTGADLPQAVPLPGMTTSQDAAKVQQLVEDVAKRRSRPAAGEPVDTDALTEQVVDRLMEEMAPALDRILERMKVVEVATQDVSKRVDDMAAASATSTPPPAGDAPAVPGTPNAADSAKANKPANKPATGGG